MTFFFHLILNFHQFRNHPFSFLLTGALMTFHFISQKRSNIFITQKKSKLCCHGNRAYQRVWLKVCLTGVMVPKSFWSHILSHSLVKSYCYFLRLLYTSSPHTQSTCLTLFQPQLNYFICIFFFKIGEWCVDLNSGSWHHLCWKLLKNDNALFFLSQCMKHEKLN